MEYLIPLLAFISGSILAWAILRERMKARDAQLLDAKTALEARELELTGARTALNTEASRRAAAEEKGARVADLEQSLRERDATTTSILNEKSQLQSQVAILRTQLDEERRSLEEKMKLLREAETKLSDSFKALSAEALRANNQSFLNVAREVLTQYQKEAQADLKERQKAIEAAVHPVKQSLDKVDLQIQALENARKEAYGGLSAQVKSLNESQIKLQAETANLVTALRSPSVRGRWGEIQLKRVVELAGMLDHCDFEEQVSVDTDEGRLRPDVIIRLPGGQMVVVDAKCPLEAYIRAYEAQDEDAKKLHLLDHARQVRDHIGKLSAKAYWEQFDKSPEFVVMFLPGEVFFSAALQSDPTLLEHGVSSDIMLASPTTLIALLKAVAYGWRQEQLTQNAEEISALGRELYERLCVFLEHFARAGAGIGRAAESYNSAIGSLERMVLPSARKFPELGIASSRQMVDAPPIERSIRLLQADEMTRVEAPEAGKAS